MKRWISLLLALLMCAGAFCARAEEENAEQAQSKIMLLIAARDFDALYERANTDMRGALGSSDGLRAVWAQLEGMFGEFSGAMSALSRGEVSGYQYVIVSADFAHAVVTLSITTDADGMLAGLSVTGFENKPAPEEVPANGVIKESVLLREGEIDESRGELTLPEGDGPFPCVIFLHGSGASDMNETAYGISVFGELSTLFAQNGIASIRFDKYTYAHPELCMNADFTVMDEYLSDARAALARVEADARISGVLLVGHSLGARVAPRVIEALGADKFMGMVLIAGTPLSLAEVIVHQNVRAIEGMDIDDAMRTEALKQVDAEYAKLQTLMNATDSEIAGQTLFSMSAYYLIEDMRANVADTLKTLAIPALIVQGGKDFQVPAEDGANAWRAALGELDSVEYAEYPDLTHLLFDLSGEATLSAADYAGEHRVSESLARDIAQWAGALAQ